MPDKLKKLIANHLAGNLKNLIRRWDKDGFELLKPLTPADIEAIGKEMAEIYNKQQAMEGQKPFHN